MTPARPRRSPPDATPIRQAPAVIDARGGGATTVVAGLPLVVRHLRQLLRKGHQVTIVCDDDPSAGELSHALARFELTMSATVSFEAPPADGVLVVPVRAVYSNAGISTATALAPVRGRTDVAAAERLLWAAIRKSPAEDGLLAYHVQRPLARLLTRALLGTRITPNQVTLTAMLCGLAAAVLATLGSRLGFALAGVLLWLGATIDCCDGDLARLRIEGSRLGEWLDTLCDDISTMALLIGLGFGLGHIVASTGAVGATSWPRLGLIGAAAFATTTALLYLGLHRAGLPIDSAYYPWSFGKTVDAGRRPGLAAAAFRTLAALFRRDLYVTALSLLLIADLPRIAMCALLAGVFSLAALLALDTLLLRRRPATRRARP